MRSLAAVLQARVRAHGSRPLLTWYSDRDRTEFSATSFANWVDKTANLLDTLGVTQRAVAGPLSVSHPGHWVSLVWPLAAWQAGCSWLALPEVPAEAELVVTGPENVRAVLPGATVACSLHPLALPLPTVPPGVLDYTAEVLAEPDAHSDLSPSPEALAWTDQDRVLSQADLLGFSGTSTRVLVRPGSPWQVLREAVLRPLLGGGSAVVVCGEPSPQRLGRIAAEERVDEPAG